MAEPAPSTTPDPTPPGPVHGGDTAADAEQLRRHLTISRTILLGSVLALLSALPVYMLVNGFVGTLLVPLAIIGGSVGGVAHVVNHRKATVLRQDGHLEISSNTGKTVALLLATLGCGGLIVLAIAVIAFLAALGSA